MKKYKETFCNLHFPTGEVMQVHIWNIIDLNKHLRLN